MIKVGGFNLFVVFVWKQFSGRLGRVESDVPLLVHLGLLELDVGAVEPVPEAEPPVAGVKPVEDQTVVTLTSYSCTIHR